jgi:hypothetical protein
MDAWSAGTARQTFPHAHCREATHSFYQSISSSTTMLNPTESQPNPPAKATRSQGRVKTVDVHPGRPLHRMEYHLGAEVDEYAIDH